MSPAINDPFTAMTCLDYIGAGLALFVENDYPQPYLSNKNGAPRLYFEPVKLSELLSAAFDMLRHVSCDNAALLLRMLDAIESIGQKSVREEQCRDLMQQVGLVLAESESSQLVSSDKAAIKHRCETMLVQAQPAVD